MTEKVQVNLEAVNLSVNSMYIHDFVSMWYLNYGAAVSEASALITPPLVFALVSTFSNLTTSLPVYLTAQFNFTKTMLWQVGLIFSPEKPQFCVQIISMIVDRASTLQWIWDRFIVWTVLQSPEVLSLCTSRLLYSSYGSVGIDW